MNDEHGTSYLVLPGAKVNPLNDQAAPNTEAFDPAKQDILENIEPMKKVVSDPSIVKGKEAQEAVKQSRKSIMNRTFSEEEMWSTPNDPKPLGLSDNFFYNWVDQQIDMKRIVAAIKATNKRFNEKFNPVDLLTTLPGRVSERQKQYNLNVIKPVVEMMDRFKITQEQIGEYLLMRHVPYANEVIAARNERFYDVENSPGTTVKTSEALKYMEALPEARRKQLEAVAKVLDKATKDNQDMLVRYGVEEANTIQAWREMFPSYIPLVRDDADFSVNKAMSQGAGMSQSGSVTKSLMGSKKGINRGQILSNIFAQHERMMIKSERNRVGNAVFATALENPNTEYWLALDPDTNVVWRTLRDTADSRQELEVNRKLLEDMDPTSKEAIELKEYVDLMDEFVKSQFAKAEKAKQQAQEDLMTMGYDEDTAADLVEKIMMPPMKARYDKRKKQVVYEPNAAVNNQFVFGTRVNGRDKYVLFNGNNERAARMSRALKNTDLKELNVVMQLAASITRFFASINTQYNPVFGAYNFLRDAQTAALQISLTGISDERAAVMKGIMPAMSQLWKHARAERKGKKIPGTEDVTELRLEGGQTGILDTYSQTEERAKSIQRQIDPSSWADSPMGKVFTANGTLKVPMEQARKTLAPMFDLLTDYNNTMENAVRLSAYKVARDKFIKQGMSPEIAKRKAAVIAKEITVNFNQRGVQATQMGALFAFFNASIQGSYMLAKTLAGPIGKKVVQGGLLLGAMQAVMFAAAGFDDEDPKEFQKARNFIIPYGDGKYVAWPYPLGFNFIPTLGRIPMEVLLSGGDKAGEKMVNLLDAFMDMFNPIGNAGLSLQTIAPTMLDPIVALAENKSWDGSQIAREDFSGLNPTPGYTRSRDAASVVGVEVARFLNAISGGKLGDPGFISPTGDQIDFLVGQLTGGVGREFLKTTKTAEALYTGEELPSYNVPLFGRFYGSTNSMGAISGTFYRNIKDANIHSTNIKMLREEGGDLQAYVRDNPEARLSELARSQYRQIQKMRQVRAELLNQGRKEEAKKVEEDIKRRMTLLNERYKEVKG
jgi:hypothetical protein